jgi:hypothetical protein
MTKSLTLAQAISTAVEALTQANRKDAVDANLFLQFDMPSGRNAYLRYTRRKQAIEVLQNLLVRTPKPDLHQSKTKVIQ